MRYSGATENARLKKNVFHPCSSVPPFPVSRFQRRRYSLCLVKASGATGATDEPSEIEYREKLFSFRVLDPALLLSRALCIQKCTTIRHFQTDNKLQTCSGGGTTNLT